MIRATFFYLLLSWTMIVYLFHAGVARVPKIDGASTQAIGHFLPKEEWGINHLVLSGPPYARGLKSGELTKHLMAQQEDVLNKQMETWVPYRFARQALVLLAIAWFQGIDDYLKPEHLEEMYGTSKAASPKYDYLVDGFTRQVAYHGLHEVGQMMVDRGFEDLNMGCTVVAIPRGNSWIVGRNFDFEGGRIFDTEKIVKWVFPEKGNPFVHIIWAGMVGAVTGVNSKGVYISINAAGSSSFRRIGTPSTLVVLDVLQEANTADEAIEILKRAQMFITDIFVVADNHGKLYRVEKSPDKTAVIALEGPSAVANHLISADFINDPTNIFRKTELTSVPRHTRAQLLANRLSIGVDLDNTVKGVLDILRDKGVNAEGKPLHLGNRRAIDALIATHAVIYDGVQEVLYVSTGPALAGPFRGYDLRESFSRKMPIFSNELPRDPQVSNETFEVVKQVQGAVANAQRMLHLRLCSQALSLLEQVPEDLREFSNYYLALANAQSCKNRTSEARINWQKALKLTPAYSREETEIKRRLGI